MKEFILKNILGIAGVIIGSIAGYLYYHFVGCSSGSCAITSNPINSVLYGALMGYHIFTIIKKNKKTQEK